MGSLFNKYWMALVLVVLTFVVYGNSLQNQFVFDDHILIVNNNVVGSWQGLGKTFISNYNPSHDIDNTTNYYRPFVLLSLGIDKIIWGMRPFGFHLTNVLMMVFLTIPIYFFVFQVIPDKKIALLSALLYLVNPVHTETVAFISGRTDLQSTFFLITSLLFYYKWRVSSQKLYLVITLLSCLVALGSKESALVFPVMLLGIEYLPARERIKWRKEYIYYFLIIVFYFVARYLVLFYNTSWQKENIDLSSLGTVAYKNWKFLKLILWPVNLNTYYTDVFRADLFGWVVSILCLALPVSLVLISRKTDNIKPVAFASILFIWGSLPAMGLIRNSSGVEYGERFVFFSSLGISVLLAWIFVKLFKRIRQGVWKYALVFLFISYCFFMGVKTIKQNTVWRNDFTLFQEMAKTSPQSYLAHFNLANEYAKRRQADSAVVYYRKAMAIKPTNIGALNNLGVLFYMLGKYELAEAEYKKAVLLSPRSPVVYYNVGLCYQQKGLIQEASSWYGMALEKDPYFQPAIDALKGSGK